MAVEESGLTALVQGAAAGDRTAWNTLVDRFVGLLWAVARSHRLDTADAGDVVQTTWLRLVENLGRIEDPERLGGWLATTARRESLAVLRRRQREAPTDTDAFLDLAFLETGGAAAAELDARLLAAERDGLLAQAFVALSAPCQRLLRALMGDPVPSYTEVSASLGMPVGSIGPRRGRCLDQLRGLVAATGLQL